VLLRRRKNKMADEKEQDTFKIEQEGKVTYRVVSETSCDLIERSYYFDPSHNVRIKRLGDSAYCDVFSKIKIKARAPDFNTKGELKLTFVDESGDEEGMKDLELGRNYESASNLLCVLRKLEDKLRDTYVNCQFTDFVQDERDSMLLHLCEEEK
jgi:hypothetical protein